MSGEFIVRFLGMLIFMVIGARLGVQNADLFSLPTDWVGFIFALVGVLFGIIITPYFTTRPISFVRRVLRSVSVQVLVVSITGLSVGLLLGLIIAYPISLLGDPFGKYIPSIFTLLLGYLGMSILGFRSKEIIELFSRRQRQFYNNNHQRELLLDSSVLIDGRIVDVAQTGFLGGVLVVPQFILSEVHQIADSSDPLRRQRGRRGLAKLNELQQNSMIEFKIIDEDVPAISKVDNKLVALAIARDSFIVTNDYNLNQIAEAQGVTTLNVNVLAKSVRSLYIPGESFPIRVIQRGREHNQGIGYLEDGTMVIIEKGNHYIDRTINVEVTKLIERDSGRILFAKPIQERS